MLKTIESENLNYFTDLVTKHDVNFTWKIRNYSKIFEVLGEMTGTFADKNNPQPIGDWSFSLKRNHWYNKDEATYNKSIYCHLCLTYHSDSIPEYTFYVSVRAVTLDGKEIEESCTRKQEKTETVLQINFYDALAFIEDTLTFEICIRYLDLDPKLVTKQEI
eukprot:GHVP01057172.1.p1 GENE.GHVP01057172.1~~GHVP01057172.1.p1  ORF type:complete len:162 (+),score=22.04 GHVP01057172.1:52-537(+)